MAALLATSAAVASERTENRVGRTYWSRPALSETSVEFYADADLRHREAVRVKARFQVVDVKLGGPWPPSDPIYEVRFEDGRHAYIDVRDFERRLYRELRSNEVATSPRFDPPLGQGVQVYQFDRASIFASDPDVVAARVRNQGPRSFQPMQGGVPVPNAPPVVTPADPVAPVISPR